MSRSDTSTDRRSFVDPLTRFLAVAGAVPERAAITRHGSTVTYAELCAGALAVAECLGDRPGVVGVLATRSARTVAALLGVWVAKGTWCPIDPAYPLPRQGEMLAAAGAQLLVDLGAPSEKRVLPGQEVGPPSLARPGPGAPGAAAYILFTSGSTGGPRPVAVSRRAIGVSSASLRELFGLTPADRVLQFASLNWDTCLEEILPTLTSGACLVFDDDAHSGSLPRFLRMVERERITVLDLPTAFWHELVNHLREARQPLPGCVRLVVIGGEAASPARLADWCALQTGDARLVNTYGCTETVLITHAADLSGPEVTGARTAWPPATRVPIGRALPHVVEHLTGDGELLVGGPALADGYHRMPVATADRFVTVEGQRFFRTGDRVVRLSDGALAFEGRVDDQIKVRGIRVDPAEVEAHIAGHPAVSAVAVTGAGVAEHTALVAHVVARPAVEVGGLPASITAYLLDRVPAHLVPGRIRVVTHLARTPSGKVDRRRITEEAMP
jgi:amino acid adenylation domain-containing protein